MELAELRKIVKGGESEFVEFKKKVAHPIKIVKEVVAFANKEGGLLLIGVSDDGSLDGVKEPDGELFLLEEEIRKRCKPMVDYTVSRVNLSMKKQILVLDIEESHRKPVFLIYNLKARRGKAYIRMDDKSIQMSVAVRKILKERYRNSVQGFNYGENERTIIKLISEKRKATLRELVKLSSINNEEVLNILVTLTVSNILGVIPHETDDVYFMRETL